MVNRPLYKALCNLDITFSNANIGLFYDKYCDQWVEKPAGNDKKACWSLDENKIRWINQFVRDKIGDEQQLLEYCNRQRLLLGAQGVPDEYISFFSTRWRFVTGLGREHPVENGFAWHQTLGVPYLPGSSIKGMVRGWVEQWRDNIEDREEKNRTTIRIFGPRNTKELAAGNVIFFDALPIEPVSLEADIMTPHYGPYYQNGEIPGDWHDPTPIPFLTVAANQTFQFGIAPINPRCETSKNDAICARRWLTEALKWIGAGAKTAVGYGRMFHDTEKEAKRRNDLEQEKLELETKKTQMEFNLLPTELKKIHQIQDLFNTGKWKTTDNAKNELYKMRAHLLKEAPKWENPLHKLAAADLLNKIFNATGWGDNQKKLERKKILDRLGRQSENSDNRK